MFPFSQNGLAGGVVSFVLIYFAAVFSKSDIGMDCKQVFHIPKTFVLVQGLGGELQQEGDMGKVSLCMQSCPPPTI